MVFLDGKLTLYKREPSLTEKTLIIVPFRLAVNTRLPQSECGESAQTRMFLKCLQTCHRETTAAQLSHCYVL